MQRIVDNVQIHIPFRMLLESYLDHFIENRFNPEIYFSSDVLDNYTAYDFNKVAEKLHHHGLKMTLHSPFWDLAPGSPDSAVRDLTKHRFEQTVRLVSIFKPTTIVCHAGYDRKRYGSIKDVWVKNSLNMWAWLSEKISAEGSHLMLENVFEQDPDDILILLENLNSKRIGCCLDVGHHAVFGRASITQWIDDLGHHIKQLHLHDNFGERDEHLALGDGAINFAKIFVLLKHLNDRPIITIEPHKEQDLAPSLQYLEKIWPWAR